MSVILEELLPVVFTFEKLDTKTETVTTSRPIFANLAITLAAMSWVPTTDFEEEIVDSQPDHDFIYGRLCEPSAQTFYPRPKAHLEFLEQQKKEKTNRENNLTRSQNHKLNLIAKIQRIAGTKPLGEQPTINDWDTHDNAVRETIALMRHVGINPGVEESLDETCTIATHPITEDMKINRNGRKHMPIFFSDKFFELKPRVTSPCSSPTFPSNKSADSAGDTAVEFNESNSTQSSTNASYSSNSLSEASSRGYTQSRRSAPEFSRTAEFNGMPKNNRRTPQSPKKAVQPGISCSSPSSNSKGSRSSCGSNGSIVSNGGGSGSRGSRGSTMSSDTFKDRSSNTANSGFESAIDEMGDEESFQTARNSMYGSRSHKWKNNNAKENIQNWRVRDTPTQNGTENGFHIQSNWRSPTDQRRKEQVCIKLPKLCSPKELYERKRQNAQK